ncbi:hypothetical protein A0H81_04109 [Grifola frondosa]|uniref:Uncharacterized protein n=1 Tax=Grifola frondosa TaxID=5627 RepID=A0A1C7MEQ1_GRIFR|nr:hypothetical protein A0H81_04109 [Grifola frondosa]
MSTRQQINAWNMETWGFWLISPPVLEHQLDDWSCGLFLMIVLKSFADGDHNVTEGESSKEDVRAGALKVLLTLLIVCRVEVEAVNSDSDSSNFEILEGASGDGCVKVADMNDMTQAMVVAMPDIQVKLIAAINDKPVKMKKKQYVNPIELNIHAYLLLLGGKWSQPFGTESKSDGIDY